MYYVCMHLCYIIITTYLGARTSVMSPIKEIIAEPPYDFKNTGFLDVCKTKAEFETSFNDSREL